MASKMKRAGASLAAAVVGVVMLCGLSVQASAGERHVIKIAPGERQLDKWSAYADLFDGKGNFVYHWQQEGLSPTHGPLRWEFTDGHDGGYLDVYVYPTPGEPGRNFTRLPLNQNYCLKISGKFYHNNSYDVWRQGDCSFQ